MRDLLDNLANELLDVIGDVDTVQEAFDALMSDGDHFEEEFELIMGKHNNKGFRGLSPHTLNEYLPEIKRAIPQLRTNKLRLSTVVIKSKDDHNHPSLQEKAIHKFHKSPKAHKIAYVLAFVLYVWDYDDNRVFFTNTTDGYQELSQKLVISPKSKKVLKSGTVEQKIEMLLDTFVKMARRDYHSGYDRKELLSFPASMVLDKLLNNFRHDHTNYNRVEHWANRKEVEELGLTWNSIAEELKKTVELMFDSYIPRNEAIRVIKKLQLVRR